MWNIKYLNGFWNCFHMSFHIWEYAKRTPWWSIKLFLWIWYMWSIIYLNGKHSSNFVCTKFVFQGGLAWQWNSEMRWFRKFTFWKMFYDYSYYWKKTKGVWGHFSYNYLEVKCLKQKIKILSDLGVSAQSFNLIEI